MDTRRCQVRHLPMNLGKGITPATLGEGKFSFVKYFGISNTSQHFCSSPEPIACIFFYQLAAFPLRPNAAVKRGACQRARP